MSPDGSYNWPSLGSPKPLPLPENGKPKSNPANIGSPPSEGTSSIRMRNDDRDARNQGKLPTNFARGFSQDVYEKQRDLFQFAEKPKDADLKEMKVDTTLFGFSDEEAMESPYIASMGVYVFKTEALLNLLRWRYPTSNDFGSEIIPAAVKEHHVQAYIFRDYWEDIGTIKSFYEANLALTEEPPKFEFYDPKTPFYTSPRFLPPTKIDSSKAEQEAGEVHITLQPELDRCD